MVWVHTFITLNRNKRSVAIDLKSERGLEVFYDLVRKSDVVINNFGAGVPAKLKIDYEHLKRSQSTHYYLLDYRLSVMPGQTTNGRPLIRWLRQSVAACQLPATILRSPVRAGIPIGDLGGGMFAVMGIQAALLERERSGKGQDVDISMLDCQISLLNYMATMHFISGKDPFPIGNSHFVHVPYDTFTTSDGFIVIAVITDNFWQHLKEVVNIPAFDNDKYDGQPGRFEDREMINRLLNETLSQQSSEYWIEKLEAARIPCAPVNKFSQALNDQQVQFRNMVIELTEPGGGSTKGPGNPIKLSRSNEESFTTAPGLGQHTGQVLTELLDMENEDIAALLDDGVIG